MQSLAKINTPVIKLSKEPMKRCSTSFIIKEIHVETTVRWQFTPTRMVITKQKYEVMAKIWRNENPRVLLVAT